jgi:uncharacterized protein YktA (UPF0223 family)
MIEYKVDFDLFTTEELVKIYGFFSLVESTKKRRIPKGVILDRYKEYQTIINNKALEKKYDKMLFAFSQVSIYDVVKKAKE